MAIKPITPDEVRAGYINVIPQFVIESFNELIQKNFDGRCSLIHLSEVKSRAKAKQVNSALANTPFDDKWLNVERYYRDAGWIVQYESPDWGDTWKPFFRFTTPSK
jgi:hypothetical protein